MAKPFTLWYIEHKNSAKSKNFLAVTNDKAEAERLVKEIPGATGIAERRYNGRKVQK